MSNGCLQEVGLRFASPFVPKKQNKKV